MGELRQAAHELTRELRADMGDISIPQEVALERLEQALVDDEPTTDELLGRLGLTDELRLTFGAAWVAIVRPAYGPSTVDMHDDRKMALRSVLLQLPAPTEPPPEGS